MHGPAPTCPALLNFPLLQLIFLASLGRFRAARLPGPQPGRCCKFSHMFEHALPPPPPPPSHPPKLSAGHFHPGQRDHHPLRERCCRPLPRQLLLRCRPQVRRHQGGCPGAATGVCQRASALPRQCSCRCFRCWAQPSQAYCHSLCSSLSASTGQPKRSAPPLRNMTNPPTLPALFNPLPLLPPSPPPSCRMRS